MTDNDENNISSPRDELEKKNEGRGELEECRRKCEEYLDGWKRAKADFINYKKEEFSRLEEVARYGTEDLIKDLIAALNSFELGIAALEKKGDVDRGIYMIRSQIEDILKKRGLEKIPVQAGEKFDPALHEAIAHVESDKPEGVVLGEVEAGYRLHDKILRPARVKVSKGKDVNGE